MKRASLIVAALVPLAVTANQDTTRTAGWDYEQLRGNWRVSEIIGSEVQSNDGRDIGEVRDIIFSSDGSIASVLVEAEAAAAPGETMEEERVGFEDDRARTERDTGLDDTTMAGAQRDPAADPEATGGIADDELRATESGPAQDARVGTVAGTDTEERDDPTQRASGGEIARDDIGRMAPNVGAEEVALGQGGLLAVDWSNPTFEPDQNRIRLDVSGDMPGQTVSFESEEQALQQGQVRASDLLGMDVKLSDDDEFGEIEDVLVSREGQSTAFVVESWNFLTRDRYAVPAELQSVNLEENEVQYQLSAEEVEGFGEFDFDDYTEQM